MMPDWVLDPLLYLVLMLAMFGLIYVVGERK